MACSKQARRSFVGWWPKAALVLLACSVGGAQTQAPANPGTCTGTGAAGKPCRSGKPPGVPEQFPYPGEETKTPDPSSPAPTQSSPTPGPNSVKDQFPYPGDQSAQEVPAPPSGGSSGSSSSSADPPPDIDGKPDLKDAGTEGSTAKGRRRLRPPAQKILSDDERVEEDLSVAHFYQQSGNLNGAYLRTKDAVKIQPQAADAHLALAEVAQKLGKRDEAIAEYNRYLELEPDGDGAKAARKGLERLKP